MIYQIVGYAGTFLIVLAYFLVQFGMLTSDRPAFSVINLVGAIGVIISLTDQLNMPAMVLECTWAVISVYGLWRALRPARA